jgi:hypothetical protein
LFNHATYEPDSVGEREGYGTAYRYPLPSKMKHDGAFIKEGVQLRPVMYDKQTRFRNDGGGRRTPYILKITYDKGRIILEEKLDPVTNKPIQ